MQFNSSLKFTLIFVGLVGLIFFIAYQFLPPPLPTELKIATGREGGAYHSFAMQYKAELKKQFGIDLEIIPTAGSVDAITMLSKGEVDFALASGGIAENLPHISKDNLASVASLFYEPLWVFHQNSVKVNYLSDLKGKKIAVGEKGSGTRLIAVHLLKDNGITAENATFIDISSAEAARRLKNKEIDAAFLVASPKAVWISDLMNTSSLTLMRFERYKAYTSRYHHSTAIEVSQGSISLADNLPQQDTMLIAVTANLLTLKEIHSSLIRIFLHVLKPIHEKGGLIEPPKRFPAEDHLDLPMHPNAKYFLKHGSSWLERFFPLGIAMQLERLSIMIIPLLTLLLPLMKSALPIYRWTIRFKIYRWYRTLRETDKEINNLTLDNIDKEIDRLSKLHQELVKQVSVPLSYMSEFYTLRVHINLILLHLKEQRQHLLNNTKP